MKKIKKHFLLFVVGLIIILGLILYVVDTPYRNAQNLIDAIQDQDVERVTALLEAGVDPNQTNAKPSKWWRLVEFSPVRPLTSACETGNLKIIKLLIDYGATAEYREYADWSPLRMTLFHCHPDDVEIVELLLEHGADPSVRESDYTAVFAAADMYPIPAGSNNSMTDYDTETAQAITKIVKMLLKDGAVNDQTEYGKTLLMYAARRGNLYLAEYLIAQGGDISITDSQGKTALDYAVDAQKQDMVELLLNHGAE